jgi:hypothetical protein
MGFTQKIGAIFVALSVVWTGLGDVSAFARTEGRVVLPRYNSISIANNAGGAIGRFVLQAAYLKRARTAVRFTGQCDSACTLLLALPKSQTCIAPGASFRFHAPVARSSRAARLAHVYMMRKYPGWVRSFINRNGGLTRRLVKMDHRYASKFIRSCGTRVGSVAPSRLRSSRRS